jgi:hypothetical protein
LQCKQSGGDLPRHLLACSHSRNAANTSSTRQGEHRPSATKDAWAGQVDHLEQESRQDALPRQEPGVQQHLWIGVKVWFADRKFWVGWAERAANGVGAVTHTQMNWVLNHTSYLIGLNLVYQIPMQAVFGPGIPIPPGTPATIDIDVELVRQRIVKSV